jgi:GR25 family glycosyltransferase involved in LPS biosynthesis
MLWYIVIILIIVILFLFLKKGYFEGLENNFDIYAITMKHKNRIDNINNQQKKINIPIQLFDAVNGNNLDLNNVKHFKNGNFDMNEGNRKRQVGCYLSHYNLYKKCKKTGYTIVFEDDFSIDVDNLIDKLNNSIQKLKDSNVEFDMMFLGSHYNEHNGTLIIDDLYKIKNEYLAGTHAYVINNKNIDKIIKETTIIDCAIDVKIKILAKNDKLNVIKIYPDYVNVIASPSTIVP